VTEPYYDHDGITIYHADCRDVLPQLDKVDLVLTDPPYGIGFSGYESHRDCISGYYEWLWPICESLENLIINGWMCIFQAAKRCRDWSHVFQREWRLIALPKTFVQILPGIGPTWATDYALLWAIGNPAQKKAGRDWFVSETSSMKPSDRPGYILGHPCPRPFKQILYLVNSLSEQKSLVLDPFVGSGTTLVAAKQLGRKAIGIEIEEKYCEIAVDRLRQGVLAL